MTDSLNYAVFTQHLHRKFTFCLEAGKEIDLELVEAIDQSMVQNRPDGYEAFSVVFRGPAQPFLPQATYLVRHAQMGEFPLFIVPIRQDREGHYDYEAFFSRMGQ